MKRFLKSSLSLILAITIIFSSAVVGFSRVDFSGLFAVKAEAASSGTCGDNLTWTLDDDGTLTISGTGKMKDYSYSSTAPWYSLHSRVKSVVINNGVTSIGDYSFDGCTSLTSITIPDSVTSIGDWTFSDCTSLTSITIPDSVTSIGWEAFHNCTKLTSITIPNSVTSVGYRAFSNTGYYNNSSNWDNDVLYIGSHLIEAKTSLSGEYTIKNGTKCIGPSAFYNCTSLTSITIPNSVTSIGYDAFEDCTNLISITIPDSVTSIGDGTFYNCISLTSVTIGNSVTSIGGYAFYNCTSLTSITIPNSVTSIGISAFYNCTSLTSITIPDSVTSIGSSAFKDCTSLTSITIPDSVTSIGYRAFYACTSLTSITIPDSVTSIGSSAFEDCISLTSVTIGNSVTSVGYRAFSNTGYCNNSSNWDNYVLYIGSHLIEAKTSLSGEYTIKNGTKCIGFSAFEDCTSLTSITIPDSVTSIGNYAFEDCTSLADVYYSGSKVEWNKINIGNGNDCLTDAIIHYAKDSHTHTPTAWITNTAATVNTVGSKYKVCTECGEVLETAVIPQLKPATPKLSKVQNTASGVKVTWGAVEGADSYIVYRRTYNAKTKAWGGWARLADDITSTSYLDKTAKSGTYYRYTVRATNEAGNSGYNTSGIKTYFLSMPKSVTTSNTTNTITVKWGKVAGATGYIVYRKTGNGKWVNLGKTTGTSFGDKTAKAGVTYKYTIKAYYGSYVSAYNTNGYAVRRLTIPTLKSAVSSKTGITFTWNKVTGATGYMVYRKTGSGGWQKIATVKTNSYLDKTAKKGVTYKYTVKAYYGTSTSYYNTKGLTIKDKY